MNKKGDLQLIILEDVNTKKNDEYQEKESISEQVAYDFHTCFDATNFFLQETEIDKRFQEKPKTITL
jgi:hypothetical protein